MPTLHLDARNLADWHWIGIMADRIRKFCLLEQGVGDEQADLNVRATLQQWVQSPDTVGLWLVRSVYGKVVGHAVALMRAEEGELYATLWQMQMDKPDGKCARQLDATVADWAKKRGAMNVRILTPHNPKVMERMFGYAFHYYQMRKDLS